MKGFTGVRTRARTRVVDTHLDSLSQELTLNVASHSAPAPVPNTLPPVPNTLPLADIAVNPLLDMSAPALTKKPVQKSPLPVSQPAPKEKTSLDSSSSSDSEQDIIMAHMSSSSDVATITRSQNHKSAPILNDGKITIENLKSWEVACIDYFDNAKETPAEDVNVGISPVCSSGKLDTSQCRFWTVSLYHFVDFRTRSYLRA